MVPRGDRSGAVVEPYLTDQWFVQAGPLAEPAIKAVEDGRIALFLKTGAAPTLNGCETSRTGAFPADLVGSSNSCLV